MNKIRKLLCKREEQDIKSVIADVAINLWNKNEYRFIRGELNWEFYGPMIDNDKQQLVHLSVTVSDIQNYINNIILKDTDIKFNIGWGIKNMMVYISFDEGPPLPLYTP